MIKEIVTKNAFTKEEQPDGSSVDIIDPYIGCQLQCPYCFQMNDANWSKDIYVNLNIASMLEQQIKDKGKGDLYIGSKCDPYMELEENYKLTRKCLEVLCHYDSHIYITTKADNQLIMRDIDLFKRLNSNITILLGLSNMKQADKGRDNANIIIANELKAQSIDVICFISPYLPYVMNLEETIAALDPSISICLDKLRVMSAGNQDKKVFQWIQKRYPQYEKEYEEILFQHEETYYHNIIKKYRNDKRIVFLSEVWGV